MEKKATVYDGTNPRRVKLSFTTSRSGDINLDDMVDLDVEGFIEDVAVEMNVEYEDKDDFIRDMPINMYTALVTQYVTLFSQKAMEYKRNLDR